MTPQESTKTLASERMYQQWDHSRISTSNCRDLAQERLKPLSMRDIRLAVSLLNVLGLEVQSQERLQELQLDTALEMEAGK